MKRHPSTGWYWAAGAVALVGVIAGIVLGITSFLSYRGQFDHGARAHRPRLRSAVRSA